MRFHDRREAGRRLAATLRRYAGRSDTIVLGLPRAGLVVADEVADKLGLPLDVFLVSPVAVPGRPELAAGAVTSGGVRVLDPDITRRLQDRDELERAVADEMDALSQRELSCHRGRPPPDLAGKIVILVDDGIATGARMRAAVQAVRAQSARSVVIAVPVATAPACAMVTGEADEIVCLGNPEPNADVHHWYGDTGPTTDDEMGELLQTAWARQKPQRRAG